MLVTLASRYNRICRDLQQACQDNDRHPNEISIIAVSKTVDVDAVQEAIDAGIHDFGENRPAELTRKYAAFPSERWHFIGNIQSRQLKEIVGRATLIHSVCQVRHIEKIEKLAAERGIVQDILLEIHNGEPAKQGISPDDMEDVLAFCDNLSHVRVRGLMIMAPIGHERAQKTFAECAQLFKNTSAFMNEHGYTTKEYFHELSMGMSDDYLLAVPYGTTMVRIGRAIFSDAYDE